MRARLTACLSQAVLQSLAVVLLHGLANGQSLTAIEITPANPTIHEGQSQTFTTGHAFSPLAPTRGACGPSVR
jgi:hypothetical protein